MLKDFVNPQAASRLPDYKEPVRLQLTLPDGRTLEVEQNADGQILRFITELEYAPPSEPFPVGVITELLDSVHKEALAKKDDEIRQLIAEKRKWTADRKRAMDILRDADPVGMEVFTDTLRVLVFH